MRGDLETKRPRDEEIMKQKYYFNKVLI